MDVFGASGRESTSFYLTMSDGVRIAVDLHLPVRYPGGTEYPTLIEMTRYWRDRGEGISFTAENAVRKGFAYLVVDERGTGASFGRWASPFSERAVADAREIVDWIVSQSWSNGLVGATGVSYPGTAAHQFASLDHPALRAIVPMSDTYDQYENLLFPGGVFNEGFAAFWSQIVFAMDRNRELEVDGEVFRQSPVDDDPLGTLLEAAIAEHAGNLDFFPCVQGVVSRDDPTPPGCDLDGFSTHTRIRGADVPGPAVYHWGSWLDGGSADGVIRAFMESSGPRRSVIGSWTHDLGENAFTGLDRGTSIPSFRAQWEEAMNFFDDILRKGKPLQDRILRYFTMGENLWKATSTWPIPGTVTDTLYLDSDQSLSPSAPSGLDGADPYEVDFSARSASEPRWLGPLFAETWYPDRASQDRSLQVYQTPLLAEDLEVTGYPVVHLFLSSTHTDGAFFVYLEDVDLYGRVTYVTEGILRGIHRKVSEDPGPWRRPAPYHSYGAADAEPLVPGEVTELAIGLQPTSYLFKAGHRIRIAIAGHDASAFRRVPEVGTPLLHLQRNSRYPSRIELPVIPR
jgi:putative CocE/NonD family hydrolase